VAQAFRPAGSVMLRADAQTEVFQRAALFFGAGRLGVQCGAWIAPFGDGYSSPPAVAVGFAKWVLGGRSIMSLELQVSR
jgi:hypothetical protein